MACTCNILNQGKPKIKKITRNRIIDTTKQYCSTSTIHGISYLSSDHISTPGRILWAIVVLLAIISTTFQVIKLYNEWEDHPVVTTLDTISLPIEEIEFPAVTICPQGSRHEIIDSVLLKQFQKFIKRKTYGKPNFTQEDSMEQVKEFIKDVYPGAKEKPTMFVKLMTSDNPDVSIQSEALFQLEEQCDSAYNSQDTNASNRNLKNDSCPEGFVIVQGSNFCIHAKNTIMTYDDATQYCKSRNESKILHLESLIELTPLNEFLHDTGIFYLFGGMNDHQNILILS